MNEEKHVKIMLIGSFLIMVVGFWMIEGIFDLILALGAGWFGISYNKLYGNDLPDEESTENAEGEGS